MITAEDIHKFMIDQKQIDASIEAHEARVTKSGIWLVLIHDLLLIGIFYLIVQHI